MRQPHKHRDVIIAWANGEEIEVLSANGKWVDLDVQAPCWHAQDYRIKTKIVKREGWVNIYPTGYSYGYPTKEEADHQQGVLTGRVACIRIEWEEEV